MVIPYRNGVRIVGDVLSITSDFGTEGVNITLLLRRANMSYNRLVRLATQLTRAGLIEERLQEGKRVYSITERGKEYLKTYQEFDSLATSFGLEL